MRRILVSDFDGTMTGRDFYSCALKRFPELAVPWKAYEEGLVSHFDALSQVFAGTRCSEAEMVELMDSMELEPDLAGAIKRLAESGWDVWVASAGCAWYIERMLGRAGISIPVFANPGIFEPGEGLLMRRPEDPTLNDPQTGLGKDQVLDQAIREGREVAYAGDGRPDLGPLLRIPPHRRFARGQAADLLRDERQDFIPFRTWSDIAEELAR